MLAIEVAFGILSCTTNVLVLIILAVIEECVETVVKSDVFVVTDVAVSESGEALESTQLSFEEINVNYTFCCILSLFF